MSNAGIRTAINRAHKKCYKHLTSPQKRIIKLLEDQKRISRELHGYNGFYSNVKRLPRGAVDWDSLSDLDKKIFTRLHNGEEKISNKLSKIDVSLIEEAQQVFNQTQFYGGSF